MMKIDIERIQGVLQRLHGWLESVRKRLQPQMERWLGKLQADPAPPEKDFVADADYFMIQQEPLRARVLVKTITIVLGLAIMYAAVAHIDEITKGEGKVIPSRQLQILQSVDGGIVSEILVREGQVVDAGQMLVRVDPTRFESSVNESNSQMFSLQAKAARLRALAEGKPFEVAAELEKNDPQTVAEERRLYESRVSELNAQLSIARQQLSQRQQELVEMRAKRDQAAQAY
jgi:adhesin transport system membrane fusion protein